MSETLTEVEKCRDGVEFDTLDSAILESASTAISTPPLLYSD